ncbi:MAG: hypothetical protein GEU99_03470 [Luteitalea sp.]|nr:hypothetical protein [Luteitalea sp.]
MSEPNRPARHALFPWRWHSVVGGRRARPAFVLLLLGGALALSGVLAYEAQHAARSHRTAAEAVLRDYVSFASWEFARLARRDLESALSGTIAPVLCAAADDLALEESTIRAAVARASAECDCGVFAAAHGFFRLDARADRLAVAGATRPEEARGWLAAIRRADTTGPGKEHALFLVPLDDGVRVVGALVRKDRGGQGAVHEVVGFEADTAAVAPVFERILEREPLLPPSLTGDVVDNSMIAVQMTDAGGRELYRSPESTTSELAATGTLGTELGGLRYHLSLRPDAADRLVIGGLPASRMPFLAGLVLLAVGLVVAAGFQLRREFELARLRSEFVSNVSHELRTPLAQIRMFTETLRLGRVRSDAERTRSLEIVEREARRLGQLVENVLRFSHAAVPSARLTREAIPLGRLTAEVVEGFAPLALPHRTRFETRLDDSVVASVDPGAFRQMLLNLLDNAVKYGPVDQTVVVTVMACGDHVRLLVEDQGPGVSEEDRDRIWEPFRRARGKAESVPGTGIGLAVVRQLVDLHGGRVWVEPRPGRGARFAVELPGTLRMATADRSETNSVPDLAARPAGDWKASA